LIIFAGIEYPLNQIEFEKDFATENDCIAYLVQVNWTYGYSCTNCSGKE